MQIASNAKNAVTKVEYPLVIENPIIAFGIRKNSHMNAYIKKRANAFIWFLNMNLNPFFIDCTIPLPVVAAEI